MIVVILRPWQVRLMLGLAVILFMAGSYRLTQQVITPVSTGTLSLDAPLFSVPGVDGLVTLAVNVDWGSEQILPMMEILKQHDTRVTFFVTGKWAAANVDLLKQMAAAGHEIANHGYSHVHPRQLSNDALAKHITDNQKLIEELVGKTSLLYAPPYGEWDRRVVQQAAKLGYRTVMWTIDTRDWQDPPADIVVARVVPKVTAGAIVLMHPKSNTVEALPSILAGLAAKRLKSVTLTEMLSALKHDQQASVAYRL